MNGVELTFYESVYVTAPHHIAPATHTTIAEREEADKEDISEGTVGECLFVYICSLTSFYV